MDTNGTKYFIPVYAWALVAIISSRQQLIADECQTAAVRRPGRHIDRALTSEQFRQNTNGLVVQVHDPQHHFLVRGMTSDTLVVSQENHPLPVGRNVREPI